VTDKALIPVHQTAVEFYDDEITAVVLEDGEVFVPIRPICDYLGVSWSGQRERLQRDAVLSKYARGVRVTRPPGKGGGSQEMTALPLDYLNGWLFGINANRVKDEVRARLVRYQEECYQVLADHFRKRIVATGIDTLASVRDLGLAIATLAQEQMEFERQVDDRFETVEYRLTAVEDRIAPGQAITEEQASQISQAVKAVAMVMTKQSGSNQYGSVYGELYRKFGITSYKLLPASRFQEAMNWLTEMHQQLTGEEPF
jgi:hypothetical protein